MNAKATHKSAKCTARKARLLRGLIIGKSAKLAIALLLAERRAGSVATVKLIRSALAQLPANSEQNAVIDQFIVNEGPRRRQFMPRAQGRATPILKKTSHLTISLLMK
jgi:large subunit ribosomal protein L22